MGRSLLAVVAGDPTTTQQAPQAGGPWNLRLAVPTPHMARP